MRKALFALPLLASVLTLPHTAYADTTDLFTLTGDSNTSGLPILGLSGSGEYRGKIVLP